MDIYPVTKAPQDISTFFLFFIWVWLEVFVSVGVPQGFWFESAEFSFMFVIITEQGSLSSPPTDSVFQLTGEILKVVPGKFSGKNYSWLQFYGDTCRWWIVTLSRRRNTLFTNQDGAVLPLLVFSCVVRSNTEMHHFYGPLIVLESC